MIFDWDEHYKKGGQSGDPEDYKLSRRWKYQLLHLYYDLNKDTIIDVGCGDLQFWGDIEHPPDKYTGLDISNTIIQKHKINHPTRKFICTSATNRIPDLHADVVICFDMLWHILDDDDYVSILKNIKQYSDNYIYIYTWNSNPFRTDLKTRIYTTAVNLIKHHKFTLNIIDDGGYQKYHDFEKIALPIFEPEFTLIEKFNNTTWKYGTMYIFKRNKPIV